MNSTPELSKFEGGTSPILCSVFLCGHASRPVCAQKLGHPMLVQPILSQKKEKSKFFNQPIFRNRNFKKVALYKKGTKAVTSFVYMVLEVLFVA